MMASVNRDSIQNGSDPMRLLSSVKPGVRRIAEGLYALSRTLAPGQLVHSWVPPA